MTPASPGSPPPDRAPLTDRVAVVAGATRGAGRGIAVALGEAGATVVCTGRSRPGRRSSYDRPETIDETAELVNAAGGRARAEYVDHTVEGEVATLFERVDRDYGRLDVLADGVAGEDPRLGGWHPFWKTDLEHGAEALRAALYSHVITAKHGAPLMIAKRRGLIVQVTEGDMPYGGGNVLSDLVKSGLKALAVRLAWELRSHGVTALALTPGFLRSETMLEHFKVTPETWREGGKEDKHFLESETPLFLGRAVSALAQDPDVFRRTGTITSSWELSRDYGFSDVDGRRPDWGRHFEDVVVGELEWVREAFQQQLELLENLTGRARQYLSKCP